MLGELQKKAQELARRGGAEVPFVRNILVIQNEQGSLGIVDEESVPEFNIRRFYFLTNLPLAASRGAHAHKKLRQLLICLQGAVTVELSNGSRTEVFRLAKPEQALVIPPGWWRVLRDFDLHSVVGVLASETYDESDYIRDWDEFLAWTRRDDDARSVPFSPLTRHVAAGDAGSIGVAAERAAQRAIRSGQYIGGEEVSSFESAFASYCGVDHAIGVANGLEALELALMATKVGPGDEVIMPAHTFIATAFAVERVGATPVLVDVDLETSLLDVDKVAAAITHRTKAIMPVHLYGQIVDMEPLRSLAESHGLVLIEDAAQAHGASYRGRRAGSLGTIAAFSFYPTKNLGAFGDAGAITTSDPALAQRVRELANYGSAKRYEHTSIGMNSRLDPIQAAFLKEKLLHLDAFNERRRDLAARYLSALAGTPQLALPKVRQDASHVWHVFQVRVLDGKRSALQKFLTDRNIGTNIHYPAAVHEQPCYSGRDWGMQEFANASQICRETLSLPLDPLHTDHEIDRVISAVKEYGRVHASRGGE